MRDDVLYTNNNNIPNWLAVHWQLILAEASNNLIYFLKRIWFDSVVCSAFSSIHPMVNLSLTFQRHPSKTTSASHDCLVEILLIRRDGARRWHRRCVYVNDDGKQHFQWKSCSFSSFLSLSLASISIPVFFLYKMCSYKLTTMRFHIFAASATVVQTVEQPARSINFCGLLYSRLYITLAPSPGSHCHVEKRP